RLGVAICWDQWFPEVARILTLQGAQLLLYPTAIGTDVLYPGGNPMAQWTRCMQGHAAANFIPVVASNRVGVESVNTGNVSFLGGSFVTDQHGALVTQADESTEGVLVARLDLESADTEREMWTLFSD